MNAPALVRLLCLMLLVPYLVAQTPAAAEVPISKEPSHHLVLENEYVKVYSVEVGPHAETLVHRHDLDYVYVVLGDSDIENDVVATPPVHALLKDGDVKFAKGGFAHKAVNNSDKPFRNVTIELKAENPARGESACFTCGKWQRYTGSNSQVLIDNGKVRVMRVRHAKGYSMGLMGMPHVMRSEGVLLIMNSDATMIDTGLSPGTGPGCPCPSKNVRAGEVFWIEDDNRYRFYSRPANETTELITIESYVPPKSKP